MSLPIRTRLTLWYTTLLAVIFLTSGSFVVLRLHADLLHHTDGDLVLARNEISAEYGRGANNAFREVTDASLGGLPRARSAAQLLSSTGRVLESTGEPMAAGRLVGPSAIDQALRGRRVFETLALGPAGASFRVLTVAFPPTTGPDVLVVATSLSEVNASVRRLIALLLIAGPAALAAAAAGGWWLAGAGLSPVARMTAKARQIGADRLSERVEVPKAADELQSLAVTLNAMLDRLAAALEQQRRFVADASHELRSPLAVMRSELDVGLASEEIGGEAREVLDSAREEVERMSRTVSDLLLMARADERRLELDRVRMDLRDVANDVVSATRMFADHGGVRIDVRGTSAPVVADRGRMREVVANLVDNAIKYSGPGGSIDVSSWVSDGVAGLTVTDTGPGMAPDVLGHVFDRFFRADPARGRAGESTGLGLAICKEVVEAHGGRIWATSRPGRGSAFSLSLPRDDQGDPLTRREPAD